MKIVKKPIYNMVVIAFFSALCYVSLYLKIPLVGQQFVHLGNLIVVMVDLLFGGVQGGLAGSIGMSLFDALNGYASHIPVTIPQKLFMGLTAGFTAAKLRRRMPDYAASLIAAACGVFVNVFVEFLYITFIEMPGAAFSAILTRLTPSFINFAITILGVAILYMPLKIALKKARLI